MSVFRLRIDVILVSGDDRSSTRLSARCGIDRGWGSLGVGLGNWGLAGPERVTIYHSGGKYLLETTRLPAFGTLFIFCRCLYSTVKCILPPEKNPCTIDSEGELKVSDLFGNNKTRIPEKKHRMNAMKTNIYCKTNQT